MPFSIYRTCSLGDAIKCVSEWAHAEQQQQQQLGGKGPSSESLRVRVHDDDSPNFASLATLVWKHYKKKPNLEYRACTMHTRVGHTIELVIRKVTLSLGLVSPPPIPSNRVICKVTLSSPCLWAWFHPPIPSNRVIPKVTLSLGLLSPQ